MNWTCVTVSWNTVWMSERSDRRWKTENLWPRASLLSCFDWAHAVQISAVMHFPRLWSENMNAFTTKNTIRPLSLLTTMNVQCGWISAWCQTRLDRIIFAGLAVHKWTERERITSHVNLKLDIIKKCVNIFHRDASKFTEGWYRLDGNKYSNFKHEWTSLLYVQQRNQLHWRL
jgi:hypothetical protein